MRKKMLSLALALVMCLSLIPCAFAAEVSAADKFTDVSANAWYLDELNYAVYNGYISGTSATTFSPDATITRGQFVTILGRMLNVSTSGGSTKFTDVDAGSWYAPYVAWAAQNGYVNGTSSTTFSPEATITVEQMAVIISNYITKSGVELSGYTASTNYKDTSSISSWAVSSMETMRQYGLLVTDAAGNVNPHKSVNRAEGAVSLVRLAKATGLGVEPVIEQKPVANGQVKLVPNTPVLADKGITMADLLPGEYEFIKSHMADDTDAADNNVRYMLKNGICAVVVEYEYDADGYQQYVDSSGWLSFGNDAYCYNYLDTLAKYPEFGYIGVQYVGVGSGLLFTIDNPTYSSHTWEELRDTQSGDAVSDEKLSAYNAMKASDELRSITSDALDSAIALHDSLWASGKITSAMTQKQKARVYYDWLIAHCSYDYDSMTLSFGGEENSAYLAYGALVEGKAVCQGYTAAYDILLRLEGIDCVGVTCQSANHGWTEATLDGVTYHIDPTWGDTTGQPNKYFAMTPEASWARFPAVTW